MQKSSFSDNLVPEEFSSKFGSLIKAALGGLDRLRLCGTLRPLFTPRWMNIYLCAAKVLLKDYSKHAQALTERVCQRARQIGQGAGRPYLYVASAQTSKEALIEQIARRDCVREGLIAVLRAVEPCVAISVRADAQKKRLSPVVQMRKCLHLYHYYEHPIWGRCNLRLQSWYPFTVDVCLNGRAWLARQMDAEGLAYCRADNCFVALQDAGRAQALADAQLLADWPRLLQELLQQAHPLHGEILSPLPALHYYWTTDPERIRHRCDLQKNRGAPAALSGFCASRHAQLSKLGCDALPGSSSPDNYRQGQRPFQGPDYQRSEASKRRPTH